MVQKYSEKNHPLDVYKPVVKKNGRFQLPFPQLVSDRRSSGCHQQYVSNLADLVCCMQPTFLKPPNFVGRETYLETKDMFNYT